MSDGLSKVRLAQFAGFSEAIFRGNLLSLARKYPGWAVWFAEQLGQPFPLTLKAPRPGFYPYPLRVGLRPRPEVVWLPFRVPGAVVFTPDKEHIYLIAPPPVPPRDGTYMMTPISPPSAFRGEELSQSHLLPFAIVLKEITEVPRALLTCTVPEGEEVQEGPLKTLVRQSGSPQAG